jgi:hypothetical protein
MVDEALRARKGDLDGDGWVAVEEAWTWARPLAIHTTEDQRAGRQEAVIVDQLDGDLHLEVPGVPAAGPSSAAGGAPSPSRSAAAPSSQEPARASEPDATEPRGVLCLLLCG